MYTVHVKLTEANVQYSYTHVHNVLICNIITMPCTCTIVQAFIGSPKRVEIGVRVDVSYSNWYCRQIVQQFLQRVKLNDSMVSWILGEMVYINVVIGQWQSVWRSVHIWRKNIHRTEMFYGSECYASWCNLYKLFANYTAWKWRLEKKKHDVAPEVVAYALITICCMHLWYERLAFRHLLQDWRVLNWLCLMLSACQFA